jgi:hypothetical protein
MSFRPAILDRDGAAFDLAELTHSLRKLTVNRPEILAEVIWRMGPGDQG